MRPQQQPEDRAPTTIPDFTSETLAFVRQAETRLRGNEKIRRTEDRAKMARNLGVMYERVQQRLKEAGDSFPLSKLFVEALGETTGESLYKKRARLLTLSSETSEDHVAYGKQYLDLVKVLCCHLGFPEKWTDERKYIAAVNQLIERTSYDYVGGYADRAKIEYQREIDKQLGKIVDKVLGDKDVDLDWMRYWTTDHPVEIGGPTGFIDTLTSCNYNNTQSDTFSIHGRVDNRLAPCVRIARVISDYYIPRYLVIKVDKNPSHITSDDLVAEVEKLMGESFLEEYYESIRANDFKFDDKLKEFEEVEGWREGIDIMDFPGWTKPMTIHNYIHVESFIDLEIRYNEQMAVWQPVILSRWPDGDGATPETCMYSGSGDKLIPVIWHPFEPFFAIQKETTDDDAMFHIFRVDRHLQHGEQSKLLILGQKVECGFYAPQKEFYDFLFAKMDDTPSSFEIETVSKLETDFFNSSYSYPIGYVKAPTNTLAFWILNNLAYAPEEERIDTLFLEDARKKNRKLRDYANQCEKIYEEAVSRL